MMLMFALTFGPVGTAQSRRYQINRPVILAMLRSTTDV